MIAARHVVVVALGLLALSALPAFGQGALLQGGPWQPGHVPQYVGQGSSQAVVQDGGGAGGGAVGVNPSEIGVTARGTGTPPYAGQGTGPYGTNICDYDAPTNNAAGYHFLCLSANAQGGGLLAYGSGGMASQLPLCFNVNGRAVCVGGTAGVGLVTTTLPSIPGAVTCWLDAIGSLTNCSASGATLFGNPGLASAIPAPFTIQGLVARGAPNANNDRIPIWDAASGTIKYVTPGLIAASATSGVSSLNGLTGALAIVGVNNNIGASGTSVTVTNASQVCYVDGVHFADLAAAVAGCTSNATIVVQSAQTISTDVAISGNSVVVKCENGAVITAANATSRLFFSGTNSAVDGCSLIGPGTGAPSYQAIVSSGDGFSLRNSRVSNWGTTGSNGTVEIICGSHINITGNQIFDNADAGIFFGTACNIDDVRITNNRVGNGVILHASSGSATLSNFIVSNNTLSSGDHGDISFCLEYGVFGGTSATKINATGNTCNLKANGANGGFSYSTVSYFAAAGNTFDAAGFTYTVAAFEAGDSRDGSFTGNTVKSAGAFPFSCAICSDITYAGNTVDGFGATVNDTGFFLFSVGTRGFLNVNYTGNTVNFAAGSAGKAFQANCGNASAVCAHVSYVGNMIVSDGTANSVGIDIIRTAGTMDGFLIGPNMIIAPDLGVRILAGVTHNCLVPGLNIAATPITNSGSASACN